MNVNYPKYDFKENSSFTETIKIRRNAEAAMKGPDVILYVSFQNVPSRLTSGLQFLHQMSYYIAESVLFG